VIPVAEHSFPVFETNVAEIGLLLVDLAAKVAVFYSDSASNGTDGADDSTSCREK
jgi:hypothetical protein